jgi:hypothetical protein
VVAPAGEYYPDKLINLGTNRWSFKPELAVSQPIGRRWLLDAYAGVWFYTANDSFYPGMLVKTQAPIGSFRSHLSYNFTRQSWAAFDVTYYVGGRTTVQGREQRSAVERAHRGDDCPAGRAAALDQDRGEQGGHRPARCRLHLILLRVADRVGPKPHANPGSATITGAGVEGAGLSHGRTLVTMLPRCAPVAPAQPTMQPWGA